ncbi:MAG: lipocalin-like domain-containing protein [Chloroflexi bacterium]|nr:lipocalin-like domain-containing protein [Chloroflexota bacterium]
MHPDSLVGVWKLVSFESRSADGEVEHLFGRDPIGQLIYTADGHMSVIFGQAGRNLFEVDDVRGGTAAERDRAMGTFQAYFGRYSVGESEVVHHVELCLFPNWKGVDQRRFFRLDGDTLTLTTPPMLARGKQRVSRLVWRRSA